MILVRLIMAAIAFVGCLGLLLVSIVAWLFVLAAMATDWHWAIAAGFFVATFFAVCRFREHVVLPWQIWLGMWGLIDDWVQRQGGRGPGSLRG